MEEEHIDNPISTENDTVEEKTVLSDMKDTKTSIQKLISRFKRLPDKKIYLEFITALLTIPVLLTVIISNLNTIKKQSGTDTLTPTPTQASVREMRPLPKTDVTNTPSVTSTPSPTPSAQCVKEVGPVSIVYPEEGETTATDPICIDISRTGTDYCAVVWSYRINAASWSDYTDKSICLYGLSAGAKKLELRVKSIVTGSETILTRNFIVEGTQTVTPTPTSTSSATLTN